MDRLLWCLPVSLVLACAHAQERTAAAPPPAPPPVVAAAPAPTLAPPTPAERSCTSDAQCSSTEICVRSSCAAITPALEECGATRVHFDFDRADLHQDELVKLQRVARCLGADRATHVVIEGNADERGTVEYNIHLGDQRATAVQRYLEGLGVPETQLATVSYGKEIPLCTEHDEACWARNRRTAVVPNGEPKAISRIERLDERAHPPRARKTAMAGSAAKPEPSSPAGRDSHKTP
jgi:peptidoglycan-associated lipoprotein